MTITHHPTPATLRDFVHGGMPKALSAIVAAHVASCDACAGEARALEDIALALREQEQRDAAAANAGSLAARWLQRISWDHNPAASSASLGGVFGLLTFGRNATSQPARTETPPPPAQVPATAGSGLPVLRLTPGHAFPHGCLGGAELTLIVGSTVVAPSEASEQSVPVVVPEAAAPQVVVAKGEGVSVSGKPRGFFSWLAQPLAGW